MAITNGNVKGLPVRGMTQRGAFNWLRDRRLTLLVGAALLIAASFKFVLLALNRVPFNADEAIVALMARHILQGERPVFFYGQAYLGSLDAYLVAAGFYLFGEQVWVIRLVQTLLYLSTLITTVLLGQRVFASRRVGVLALFLLAIPTVNVSLYTTVSLGGYGEALLLGNLILLVALQFERAWRTDRQVWLWTATGLWGFLSGLWLWGYGLTMIYSLPAGLFLLYKLAPRVLRQRQFRRLAVMFAVLAAGFLVGASAWLAYAVQQGSGPLIFKLGSSAAASAASDSLATSVLKHMLNLLLLGTSVIFGLRPPWEVSWLGLPLLPFTLLFWLAVCAWMGRKAFRHQRINGQLTLLVIVLVFLLGFLFTPYGGDPSGRYFVPLAVPLALFGADWILVVARRRKSWAYVLLTLVIVYQSWGNVQAAISPTGLTTQFTLDSQIDHHYDVQLTQFLKSQGETTGYSNYWVAYPLAFLSKETLIFIPRLPYRTNLEYFPDEDRYPPYDLIVGQASHVAYITTKNPELDVYLAKQFQALHVSWSVRQIGDYRVYYHLSRVVRPEEIGLGETSLDTIGN